jgi:hypothetical protein
MNNIQLNFQAIQQKSTHEQNSQELYQQISILQEKLNESVSREDMQEMESQIAELQNQLLEQTNVEY